MELRKPLLLKTLHAMPPSERTRLARTLGVAPEYLFQAANGHRNLSLQKSLRLARHLKLTLADVRPDLVTDVELVPVPLDEYRGLRELARQALAGG
mgnify:CR=1 FL=1